MNWSYFLRFFDNYDSGASLRNALFALVVCASVLALYVAMGAEIIKGHEPLSSEWNVALGLLLSAVTATKIGGQKILADSDKARMDAGVDPTPKNKKPDTPSAQE